MKVLYHHRTASRDGQSTHIEEMIKALRSLGCEVSVAAPSVDDSVQTGGSGGWAGRLKTLLPRPIYELMELGYSALAFHRLYRAVRSERPDFIYERYNLFLLAGVWSRCLFRLPLILEVNAPMALERRQYGGLALPWLADWAERYVWRNADAVLPVSHVLAEHIERSGVPRSRISVIPNGINTADYDDLPSQDAAKTSLGLSGCVVIGFTGFVREWDRLDRVVTWLAGYKHRADIRLLIVGDGPARPEIEECAARLGVADRVVFTGVVSRREVPRAAAAFDIALQTALVPYASPLCLFEYLAMGIATVAPDQPNHTELLTNGKDALLYAPDSAAGLENAIQALCEDQELRFRIAAAGQRLISTRRLTWRHHAIDVMSIGRKAMQSGA